MARRKKSPHPSLLEQQEPVDDGQVMGGFPAHGDNYTDEQGNPVDSQPSEPPYEYDDEEDDDEDEDDDPRFSQLEQRLNALQRENDLLKRQIPPAQPAQPQEQPQEDDVDWDQLLFENPKEALRLHGERVADQVKRDLTEAYQREQSSQRFWQDFYAANPDLRDDHDLVQTVLSKNFQQVQNLPSNEAIPVLADMTRQKIQSYQARGGTTRRKAVAEGNSPPSPQPAPQQGQAAVTSIGDHIKKRRNKRRAVGA